MALYQVTVGRGRNVSNMLSRKRRKKRNGEAHHDSHRFLLLYEFHRLLHPYLCLIQEFLLPEQREEIDSKLQMPLSAPSEVQDVETLRKKNFKNGFLTSAARVLHARAVLPYPANICRLKKKKYLFRKVIRVTCAICPIHNKRVTTQRPSCAQALSRWYT